MTVEQPREVDGRFGSHDRAAGDAPSVHNGGVASFSFPPMFDTAEEHIQHYMTAPVSDRILSNAMFAYEYNRELLVQKYVENETVKFNEARARGEEWAVNYDKEWKEAVPGITKDEIDKRFFRIHRNLAQADEYPIESIDERVVDKVVRAAWMYRKAAGLPAEELEKIDNYEVNFGTAKNPVMHRTADIVDTYHTRDWINSAVTDTDLRVAKSNERANELLWMQLGGEI